MLDNMLVRREEVARPEKVECPYENRYQVDVVVVGCGFAGLNAAVSAKLDGAKVLIVDKGRPGYSGLAPWPSSFRWFDPEMGDEAETFKKAMQQGGDYISNLDWFEIWLKESKDIYKRLKEWGILTQYTRAEETGDFYEMEDFVGYREMFAKQDRHTKWVEVLHQYEIPYLEHVMVTDVLTVKAGEKERTNGVIGMHVPSGEFLMVEAKAVVLATGGGSYKPTGFPTGTDTFDGEYMAYQLGLPIAGKEFEDFHNTNTSAPGNVFADNHWQYLENIWLCGGDVSEENIVPFIKGKAIGMVMKRVWGALNGIPVANGSEIQNVADADFTRRGASKFFATNKEEVRSGKRSTPTMESGVAGAAIGMCSHLTSGVFTGLEEFEGRTDLEGLYVAGDGIHATAPGGAAYPCGVGFTSCFCSIDGSHAGKGAAEFAKNQVQIAVDLEQMEEKVSENRKPLELEKGFDPNWARDVLHAIMAPYWVSVMKTEATLQAALVQVEYMRDYVIPKLVARSGHDLRLCIEMKHKVLSAEMKLRASLYREESRGNHYRADIPYRRDEKFLSYTTIQKTADGAMHMASVPVKEAWKGNQNLPYEKRYLYFFPGEAEEKEIQVEPRKNK